MSEQRENDTQQNQPSVRNDAPGVDVAPNHGKVGLKIGVFAAIAVIWIVIDQVTKSFFTGVLPGTLVVSPILGIIDIRLVHNTGGAWGIFSDSTFALGILSVVICCVILGFFVFARKDLNLGETVGLALIFAGGIGNAIDRFFVGYVTDFLEFSFFDFPVFNIADCGVTCGFVILVIGIIVNWKTSKDA